MHGDVRGRCPSLNAHLSLAAVAAGLSLKVPTRPLGPQPLALAKSYLQCRKCRLCLMRRSRKTLLNRPRPVIEGQALNPECVTICYEAFGVLGGEGLTEEGKGVRHESEPKFGTAFQRGFESSPKYDALDATLPGDAVANALFHGKLETPNARTLNPVNPKFLKPQTRNFA